jgi:hypothetical protein
VSSSWAVATEWASRGPPFRLQFCCVRERAQAGHVISREDGRVPKYVIGRLLS